MDVSTIDEETAEKIKEVLRSCRVSLALPKRVTVTTYNKVLESARFGESAGDP